MMLCLSVWICIPWLLALCHEKTLQHYMLHGITEMLYTKSGSSEVTLNDAEPFSVELSTILAIDCLEVT